MVVPICLVLCIIAFSCNVTENLNLSAATLERCEICKISLNRLHLTEIKTYKALNELAETYEAYFDLGIDKPEFIRMITQMCPLHSDFLVNYLISGDKLNDDDKQLVRRLADVNISTFSLYPFCSICKVLLKRVILKIEESHRTHSHQFLLKILAQGCKLLKNSIRQVCTNFVLKKSSLLVNALAENMGPKFGCTAAKLCRDD